MTDPRTLSRQLGYLFLTADWDRERMIISAERALGGRPGWLISVIDQVIGRFPTKPADRPDELASGIDRLDDFRQGLKADHAAGLAWRVGRIPVVDLEPPNLRMTGSRWPVPAIGTEEQLADLLRVDLPVLLWLADVNGLQRRTPPGDLHPYRYRWLERPGRTPRLLEIPRPLLRDVQRRLLHRVLDKIPVHSAAYGFVAGRDARANAVRHAGSDWVINIDLRSFFSSVRAGRGYAIMRHCGYPESVARLITGLIGQRTPYWVLRGMPGSGDTSDRAWLRAALSTRHLPQGAPSSPAIANLASFRLDRRLQGLADDLGHRYTRYADDLAFSGDGRMPDVRFLRLVRTIIAEEGFRPNDAKQRSRTRGSRQLVTGIVINERLNPVRSEYDRLRAILHDAARNGAGQANRHDHPDFRAQLDGRIGWVERLNPGRGARLRAQFAMVDWQS